MERDLREIIRLIDVTHSGWNRKRHKLLHQGLVIQCEFTAKNDEPYEYKIVEVSASGKVKKGRNSVFEGLSILVYQY